MSPKLFHGQGELSVRRDPRHLFEMDRFSQLPAARSGVRAGTFKLVGELGNTP